MIGNKVFSFNSIAIFIGVLGGLSAVVTLFIDVNSQISTKWILFLSLLFLTFAAVSTKVIIDLASEKDISLRVFEIPIKGIAEQAVLVIRPNPLFNNNCLVGGYFVNDEIETFAFVGYVFHIQEKITQIKVTTIISKVIDDGVLFDANARNKIIIRPIIPFNVMDTLGEEK